jgi:1-acyl-sn-glycerol-3-phosphate acyltransferase
MRDAAGRSEVVRLRKLLMILAQLARAGWIVAFKFPRLDSQAKLLEIRRWANSVLAILEIEVQSDSLPPERFAGLVVSNHLSWLDILVMQSIIPGCFVAKSEVRRWPLIGYLSNACATIFVDRSAPRSMRAMLDRAVCAIEQGYAVIAFPEGTSTDGEQLGTFHPNIFESAVRAQGQVQLVSLRYVDHESGQIATAIHFTGDMTLASSIFNVLKRPRTRAKVQFGQQMSALGQTRKSLAAQAHAHISELLAPQMLLTQAVHHAVHA